MKYAFYNVEHVNMQSQALLIDTHVEHGIPMVTTPVAANWSTASRCLQNPRPVSKSWVAAVSNKQSAEECRRIIIPDSVELCVLSSCQRVYIYVYICQVTSLSFLDMSSVQVEYPASANDLLIAALPANISTQWNLPGVSTNASKCMRTKHILQSDLSKFNPMHDALNIIGTWLTTQMMSHSR